MISDGGYVVEDGLPLIFEREPVDRFPGFGAGTFTDILESIRSELCGFEAGLQQTVHDFVGKRKHSALGVMDHEEFLCAEQLVADYERPNRVFARASAPVRIELGAPAENPE